MENLRTYIKTGRRMVDSALRKQMPTVRTRPATLHEAMRYSMFAGGKRLRPILTLAAAEACGGKKENALPMGCAVECIHTYSLIHDDLPIMDDDDWRRGNPTCHVKFGDGIAVLAGDGLQALAFECLLKARETRRYKLRNYLEELSYAAGSRALVAGQVLDIEAEGSGGRISLKDLVAIHERKTAALLVASLRLGAMSANATPAKLEALTVFGKALGLAFQVIDDILDVTQSKEQLGKSAGKDADADKATFPALMGLDASKAEAVRLTNKAHRALDELGASGDRLRSLADCMLDREN